jgi:hypothetical protein
MYAESFLSGTKDGGNSGNAVRVAELSGSRASNPIV